MVVSNYFGTIVCRVFSKDYCLTENVCNLERTKGALCNEIK